MKRKCVFLRQQRARDENPPQKNRLQRSAEQLGAELEPVAGCFDEISVVRLLRVGGAA